MQQPLKCWSSLHKARIFLLALMLIFFPHTSVVVKDFSAVKYLTTNSIIPTTTSCFEFTNSAELKQKKKNLFSLKQNVQRNADFKSVSQTTNTGKQMHIICEVLLEESKRKP